MATTNRDFIVKHGLRVATGITFPDGTVQTTAATGGTSGQVPYGTTFPQNPTIANLFFNTSNGKLYVFFGSWIELAYATDPESSLFIDGGLPSSTVFARLFDGGTPSETYTNPSDTFIDGGVLA